MSLYDLQPVGKTHPETRAASLRPRTDSQDFRALMEESLHREKAGFGPADPPVSKEQLMDIVHKITMQMDACLMQAFAAEARPDIDRSYPGLGDRSRIQPAESSNKQHPDQNIDVSDPLSRIDVAAASKTLGRTDIAADSKPPSRIDLAIEKAARTHGVDPALVRSVIQAESNFDPNCTSPKGAMGLMQLMPETARELGVRNGYDPVENVSAGTRYLKMLLNRYEGDIPLALSAYNWGMGNVEKKPGQMPTETRRYVDQVTRRYAALKA